MRNLLVVVILIASFVVDASLESSPSCSAGSVPVLLLQHNATIGRKLKQISNTSLDECSEQCSLSQECHGVSFRGSRCSLFGEGSERAPKEALVLRKTCVKSERVCSSPFHFDVFEQKILVGFAREVVPAESLEVCLTACLNSFDSFGFECESAMFYPKDTECILNTEDRLDRPDLFVDELDDQVIYFDNNCAGSQCYAPYITQYIAVEGKQLENELDRIINVDFESCQSLCTQRLSLTAHDFNCKSFMYSAEKRTCILSDERSKPLGRAALIPAGGFTYYEKKCFASPTTCRNSPSFTRVPQMILVGFAAFVMENVPSVTMCLDQCTNPPPETGEDFVCKSVMYYYNEQECILNAETRESKPDLFIPEGDEFLVDYFDISCHLSKEACPKGSALRAVRTLNAALPEGEGSLHVLKSDAGSVAQCISKCFELAPEKCRSINFDKHSKTCDLLYLDGKNSVRPVVRAGVDLYDLHCLAVDKDCSLTKDGAIFSRYLHTRQRGAPSKEYKVVSLNSCLEVCARSQRCEGVNYNRRVGQCALFEAVDEKSDVNEHVDFYKNLCVLKEVDSGVSSAANLPPQKNFVSATVTDRDHKAQVLSTKKNPKVKEQEHRARAEGALTAAVQKPLGPPVAIASDAVHTICNYEGIKVQVRNDEKFSGVMFVKNRYDTCRVEVENSESATLVLGLPKDFGMRPISLDSEGRKDKKKGEKEEEENTLEDVADKNSKPLEELRQKRQATEHRDCAIQDMLNGTYKAVVVVQTNNLGIPGLVTEMDQLYEVSCDYSSMLGGKVTAGYNMTVTGPEANLIQPRGKIELGNPVLMQVLGADGSNVVTAKLGDILELRWEIMAMDAELDFFVTSCYAEAAVRGGGEKLQLIENGCPTPAVAQKLIPGPIEVRTSAVKFAHMQAFRFDSSSTVRVTCQLEICKGDCQPVSCSLKSGQQESWGRKKREDNSITEYETRRYKVPRYAQATTSIVIVDPLQSVNEPVALQRAQSFDLSREEPVSVEMRGQLCMPKLTLLAVFGLLLLLTFVQAVVVAHYVFRRVCRGTCK